MISIDYRYIAETYPDVLRREPKRIDWLSLMGEANLPTHLAFKEAIDRYKFLASHNYQVASLEHLINSEIPLSVNAEIIDAEFINDVFIGLLGENYVSKQFVYKRSEGINRFFLYGRNEMDEGIDFVILINETDAGYESIIRGLVNGFVQGGKRFVIQTTS